MSVSTWWQRVKSKCGFGADANDPARADAASAMGRRLRRKFILVAMGAVTAVLALIIAGINIVNYSHVCKTADARLDYILAGKGSIDWEDEPKTDPGDGKDVAGSGGAAAGENGDDGAGINLEHVPIRHFEGMTAESPFDTRYFTVTISGGQVVDINTARIAAVGTKRASRIASELYSKGWTSGFSGNYRYTATVQGEETTYVFVDCSRELASFRSFLSASVAISCIGWLAVLAIVLAKCIGALAAAACAVFYVFHVRMCGKSFGGITGDLCGMCITVCETVTLLCAVIGGMALR